MSAAPPRFEASQFTPTKWDSAEDKAAFANKLAAFIAKGFPRSAFTKKLYTHLSNTFGHIAHYDIHGFWAEYFTTDADKIRFVHNILRHGNYGDPAYTYCDVEAAVADWLGSSTILAGLMATRRSAIEAAERAELARLLAKYGVPAATEAA